MLTTTTPKDEFVIDTMLDSPAVQALATLGACERALTWARAQGCYVTGQELWERCTEGPWLLWFLVRLIPAHPHYHRFIVMMVTRALLVGIQTKGFGDPQVQALQAALEAKEYDLAKGYPDSLKERVHWAAEEAWQLAFSVVWDRNLEAFEQEKARWVTELKQRFPLKISLQEKKGKPVFKVDSVPVELPPEEG